MNDKMVSLELNADVVKPIIEKRIAAAIADGLGGADGIIERMVHLALSVKVDSNGKQSEYRGYNNHDFLEVMTGNMIRESAKEAMKQWVQENGNKIKAAVVKEMMKPNSCRKIANAFADAAIKSVGCYWKPNIEIKFFAKEE